MPSLSFMSLAPVSRPRVMSQTASQLPGKAGAIARVAHVAVAQPLHFQQHGVIVAIDEDFLHFEPIPGGFALRPQLVARAAEEGRKTAAARFGERLFVHE